MKKVKVTNRPARRENLTLLPQWPRMFFIYMVLFTFAIGAGLLIRLAVNRGGFTMGWLSENWPSGVGIIVGGAALLALIERSRWTLRVIGRDSLEGPGGAFGERITIPFREINWTRTQRSLSSGLKIGNAIYGSGRNRIIINQWFFNPAELRELLELIGYKP